MSEHTDPPPEGAPSTADVKAEALKPDSLSANEIPPSVSASTVIADPVQPSPVTSRTESPGDIPAAPIAHNHFPAQAHPSEIDIWSTRLAAWAQIATVVVVVFGYFYTVRPVFQLQLLQEQTAQLQLDNTSAKQRLDQTKAEQVSAQAKLNALGAELANMAKNRDDLADQLKQENQKEVQAMQKMASAQMELSSQTGTLLLTQRRLLYSRFAGLFFLGLRWGIPPPIENDDEDGRSFTKIQAAWPNPFLAISGALDELEKNNNARREFPPELVQSLRRTLEDKKRDLICEPFPAETLGRGYREDMDTMNTDARKDAIAELERQRTTALANGARMTITDADIDQFSQVNRIGRSYMLHRKYEDKIVLLRKACVDKGKEVLDLMLKQI
jgi:hypothetical protein